MVCFATVLVTNVRTIILCIIAPKGPTFSVKNEILRFLSGVSGFVAQYGTTDSVFYFAHDFLSYPLKEPFQMIIEPIGDQGFPRLLPQ